MDDYLVTSPARQRGHNLSDTSSKISEADRWAALPERGTSASLQVIAWIAVRLGPAVTRLLLYPITVYFLITADAARRASFEFLKRARGRSVHWRHVFRHLYCFAATILDRLYLLRGEFERFCVTIQGKDVLKRQMETGKGAILLGSHLGSFEVLRALGVMERSFPLKVLMDTGHNQNITRFFDALNPRIAGTVIAPDQPDTLIRIRESLEAGYFVGMLGDRVFGADKTTQCQFLGAPATFPAGPVMLAALMHCPVVLFFGLYRGRNRYEIYFEHFASEISLDREHRAGEIQSWMQRYVARLEYYARLAPYNWFNFYQFWDQSSGDLSVKSSSL